MVLMCQELEMPNCIRLWDNLLADHKRFEFLEFVCAAVVLNQSEEIMRGDFAAVMECL